PPGTIKSWTHRGMKLLRSALPAAYAGVLAGVVSTAGGLAATRAAVLAEHARMSTAPLRTAGATRAASTFAPAAAGVLVLAVTAVVLAASALWPRTGEPPAGRGRGEERTTGLEQGAGQRVAAEPGIRSRIRPERSAAGLQVRV